MIILIVSVYGARLFTKHATVKKKPTKNLIVVCYLDPDYSRGNRPRVQGDRLIISTYVISCGYLLPCLVSSIVYSGVGLCRPRVH